MENKNTIADESKEVLNSNWFDKSLVSDGYVREIETFLDRIIPIGIYYLCADFYFRSKFIYCLTTSPASKSNIYRVANFDTRQIWNFKIVELDNNSEITIKDVSTRKWSIDAAGISAARNIEFPLSVFDKLRTKSNNKYFKTNNVFFRCGGLFSDYCGALIMNPRQINIDNKNTNVIAYNWKLPCFPHKIHSNSLVYSNYYNSLFSIGGDIGKGTKNIYKLTFNKNCVTDWNIEILKLDNKRSNACCSMIGIGYEMNKLICIGGFDCDSNKYTKKVEIFDFTKKEKREVARCNVYRKNSGSCYEHFDSILYVGGGLCANDTTTERNVEYFNIRYNKWFNNLPLTKKK
eukprot:427060_1